MMLITNKKMNSCDWVERLQNTGNEFLTKKKYLWNKVVSGSRCSLKSILFETEVAFQVTFDQTGTAKPDNKVSYDAWYLATVPF